MRGHGRTNGCAIFDAGYNWDQAGNLITQTFSTGSRYVETYSYDGLNRLTQAKLLRGNPEHGDAGLRVRRAGFVAYCAFNGST